MGIPIIDSLFLASDLPLDSRSVVNIPSDVSRYFYGGFIGFETSGNLPFYIDNSLNVQYFLGEGDVSALLESYVLKTGDTISGDIIIQTDLSVNGRGQFGQLNISGTSFPVSTEDGDLLFRTDLAEGFSYDASRGKWLSVAKTTYMFGRNTLNAVTPGYLTSDGAIHSSTVGIIIPYNSTILSATVLNSGDITRDTEIRANNITLATLSLTAQSANSLLGINQDVSAGDILHIYIPASAGNTVSNMVYTVELARR